MKSVWKIYLAIMLVISTFVAIAVFLSLFIFWKPVNKSGNLSNANSSAVSPVSTTARPHLKEVRENLVKDNESKFARLGCFLSLEGEGKDVLTIKTATLETGEVEMTMRQNLTPYKDAGFTQIIVTGADGEKKIIDLR